MGLPGSVVQRNARVTCVIVARNLAIRYWAQRDRIPTRGYGEQGDAATALVFAGRPIIGLVVASSLIPVET